MLIKKSNNEVLAIDETRAMDLLLTHLYLSEWEVIDGMNQHPLGLNYYQWLHRKGVIDQKELDRQMALITEVKFDD